MEPINLDLLSSERLKILSSLFQSMLSVEKDCVSTFLPIWTVLVRAFLFELSKVICEATKESIEKYFCVLKLSWGPVQPYAQNKTHKYNRQIQFGWLYYGLADCVLHARANCSFPFFLGGSAPWTPADRLTVPNQGIGNKYSRFLISDGKTTIL